MFFYRGLAAFIQQRLSNNHRFDSLITHYGLRKSELEIYVFLFAFSYSSPYLSFDIVAVIIDNKIEGYFVVKTECGAFDIE